MHWNRQRVVLAVTALLLVLLGALVLRGLHKSGALDGSRFNDFTAYHTAARSVIEGKLVTSYDAPPRSNLYPPTFAILAAPLGLLGERPAAALWVALNAGLVLYIFRRLERCLLVPLSLEARILGFLLVFRLLDSDFSNGNANLLVLALVLGSFDLEWSRGPVAGGLLFSLAILSKVSPVLALPWALARLQWRRLGGVILGLALFGGLLPVVVLGPGGAREAWKAWARVTILNLDPGSASYAVEPGAGYEPGQSLRALVHRLLRRSDATSHDGEVVTIHLLDLPKETADRVYLALVGGVLAAALIAGRRRAPLPGGVQRPEEIAAACAAMVLLAPLSRKAHFVALWPAAVLGLDAFRNAYSRSLERLGAALWSLAFVAVVATSPGVVGRELSTKLLAYCPLSLAAGALLFLCVKKGYFPQPGKRGCLVGE